MEPKPLDLVLAELKQLENTPSEMEMRNAMVAEPGNFLLRAVYADLLDERGDPRAAGYRAIGMCQLSPAEYTVDPDDITKVTSWGPSKTGTWFTSAPTDYPIHQAFDLPHDWFEALGLVDPESVTSVPNGIIQETRWTPEYPTTLDAEDHAALAFLKLPAERQEQLRRGVR